MSDSIYQAPQSNLDPDDEATATMRRLKQEQSMVGIVLGTVFGLVPSLMLVLFVYQVNNIVAIFLALLPGLAVGISVSFCGRPYELSMRLIPSLTTMVVMLAVFFYYSVMPLLYILALINGLVVIVTSKRSLNGVEEKALYAYRLGRLQL